MASKQKGLQRPRAPVDLFTLQPEEELVPEVTTHDGGQDTADGESSRRFKTSVEFTPECLDTIALLKAEYRRKHQRHLPLWRILDEAVRLYAARELGNT